MNDYEQNEQLKELLASIYKGNEKLRPKEYLQFTSERNEKNGFDAQAFSNKKNIVIVYRGTDEVKDWTKNNLKMASALLPAQKVDATEFYNKIKKDFPSQNIILTGHSLGGSLAQIIGSETGDNTVTFGAYGVKNILKTDKKFKNIINYGEAQDPVFVANIDNQLGKTYVINRNESNKHAIYKENKFNINYSIDKHFIKNMGDLSNAVEYRGQNLQDDKSRIIKAGIEKNIDLRDFDSKRIITNEEIGEMSSEEFQKSEDFINQQIKNGKVMPKNQADAKVQDGDLIWVDDYTRDDGTPVKGYYRSR